MAYYEDSYFWPQEHTTYDLVDYKDSVSFSGYESNEVSTYDAYTISEFHDPYKSIDHYHNYPNDYNYNYNYDYGYGYGYDNSYSSTSSTIGYFGYNYMEPKYITYEPSACETGYVTYHTNYSISNSQFDSMFNEPEFEEYDPTPYGGGYDIVEVYGKPLPPSNKTCYPRSNLNPTESIPKPNSYPEPEPKPISTVIPPANPNPKPILVPVPISIDEPLANPNPKPVPAPAPAPDPAPAPAPAPVLVPVPMDEPEPKPQHVPVHIPHEPVNEPLNFEREATFIHNEDIQEYCYPGYGYDYPWPEYDHGYGNGVGYDYGYGKQVVQVAPCEYNPEVVDLCESIFGSWPCLARIRRQQTRIDNNPGIINPENRQRNPWENCVNYFFRNPVRASYNQ